MIDPSFVNRDSVGLLQVAGPDARTFLHGVTTQDIAGLGENRTTRAAWLSPKGRVRALFDVVPDGGDGYWLVTAADNIAFMATEIRKYVLRAAVGIEPATSLAVVSLLGTADAWLEVPASELAPGAALKRNDLTLYRVGPARIDVIGSPEILARACADLGSAGPDAIESAAIAAGRARISAELRERYTPHMLSLDLVGAVSFTKGCYPGQEIVARTQNLGQAKRRLRRFRLAAGPRPEPGEELLGADGREAGQVNRAASIGTGHEILAVARIDPRNEPYSLGPDRELEALPLPFDQAPLT